MSWTCPKCSVVLKVAGGHEWNCGRGEEKFWAQVRKTDTCWLYEGTIGFEGYGYVNRGAGLRRKQYQAHRYAWIISGRELPKHACLLHKCDERRCVNPYHLYVGDRFDNSRDMYLRGRANTKLNPEAVLDIRASFANVKKGSREAGALNRQLAEKYGISDKQVISVRQGRKWKHVQRDAAGERK